MTSNKTPVRLQRFDELEFMPRFEYGEMAGVAGICSSDDGTELGTGWGKLTHARIPWTGFICLSQNGSPGFGRLVDNVHTSVCQNAVGVTKGTAGGMLAADMACGIDNELIGYMQSPGEPNLLPIRPLLGIGVRARLAWELWKARKEV